MNMKKSPMLRAAAVMVVLCMALSCAVFGTMAKYTSYVEGSDSVTVAKWSFTQNGTELIVDGEDAVTFNLFETITNVDGSDEEHVDADRIAPGTAGTFDIAVKNESEVDAEYTIDYTVNNNGVPVKYSIDGGQTWTDDLADVTTAVALDRGETTDVTVQWQWVFDGDDDVDTALGIAAQNTAAEVSVTAKLTVNQVD